MVVETISYLVSLDFLPKVMRLMDTSRTFNIREKRSFKIAKKKKQATIKDEPLYSLDSFLD